MLLKCKSTLVKVGLWHTLMLNSPSQIVSSTSKNDSEEPEALSHLKMKVGLVVKHIKKQLNIN